MEAAKQEFTVLDWGISNATLEEVGTGGTHGVAYYHIAHQSRCLSWAPSSSSVLLCVSQSPCFVRPYPVFHISVQVFIRFAKSIGAEGGI
jgi:hypothetical protein